MVAVNTVIELVQVWKRYGGVVALEDVSLEVDEGEAVLLEGPSGSGKSTLLRLLYGVERADDGMVRICDREVSKLQRSALPFLRRNIGMVFQDLKLLADRSAAENVAVAAEIVGLGWREARRRTELALGAVGLSATATATVPAGKLSLGEQQRVAIARAIVGSPAILLGDEPTGMLDDEQTENLLELFDLQRNRGVTMIVATHNPRVAAFAAERGWRRVLMEDGAAVVSSPPPAEAPLVVAETPPSVEAVAWADVLRVMRGRG